MSHFDLVISKSEVLQWTVWREKKTHLLLTVVSGAPGDVMQGSEERTLPSVSTRGSTQAYLEEGIKAGSGFWPNPHHCLRHGHLPNSCGKPQVLHYCPCPLGSSRSTRDHRARPGEAALPAPGTHWPQEKLAGFRKWTLQATLPCKNIAHIARV